MNVRGVPAPSRWKADLHQRQLRLALGRLAPFLEKLSAASDADGISSPTPTLDMVDIHPSFRALVHLLVDFCQNAVNAITCS